MSIQFETILYLALQLGIAFIIDYVGQKFGLTFKGELAIIYLTLVLGSWANGYFSRFNEYKKILEQEKLKQEKEKNND